MFKARRPGLRSVRNKYRTGRQRFEYAAQTDVHQPPVIASSSTATTTSKINFGGKYQVCNIPLLTICILYNIK